MTITIQPISGSSQITGAGYDDATKTMAVRFKGGATYHYADVPQAVFTALLQSPSAGSYFHTDVRGKYAYVKA